MARRLSSKAAANEEANCTLCQYVEPLSEARTPLAGLVNGLLDTVSDPVPSRKVQASAVTTISLRLGY